MSYFTYFVWLTLVLVYLIPTTDLLSWNKVPCIPLVLFYSDSLIIQRYLTDKVGENSSSKFTVIVWSQDTKGLTVGKPIESIETIVWNRPVRDHYYITLTNKRPVWDNFDQWETSMW